MEHSGRVSPSTLAWWKRVVWVKAERAFMEDPPAAAKIFYAPEFDNPTLAPSDLAP